MSSGSYVARAHGLLAACLVLIGMTRQAAACSIILPDEPESLRCDDSISDGSVTDAGAHTVASAVTLQVDDIEVRRSLYPPPGYGDCGELGRVALRFRLAGNARWPTDVGVLINHVAGEFPWFQPPLASTSAGSGWLLGTTDGEVSFLGPDDPRQPVNVRLVARVLDCSGDTSAPLDVIIADPGRPEMAGPPEPSGSSPPVPPASSPEPPDAVNADAGVVQLARSSPGACAMPLGPSDTGLRLTPSLVIVLGIAVARRSRRQRAS